MERNWTTIAERQSIVSKRFKNMKHEMEILVETRNVTVKWRALYFDTSRSTTL